eukprot:s1410_g10.t2
MLTHFDKLGLGLVGLVDKFGLGKDIEGGETIDWATAEAMSFASLLLEGNHVRITGQDVQRGTFAHRHCVENFIARNSILSEYGVLGFELGYSYENPRALVIWEAQFGDFANTAQVMVDQFVSAGEHKWLQQTGQGAEHSSCRLERFLQLSDDDEDDIPAFENDFGRNQVQKANWQVMNISTPANYFHALRRQQHRDFRKPMILASPKNLFRLRQCVSKLSEMGPGSRFRRLIPERDQKIADNPEKVKRLVFCSGKLYYELVAEREQLGLDNVAIVTLEQIAPFPFDRVKAMLEMYPNVDIGDGIHPGNVIWCQEEPKNMGAWSYASVSESADKEPAGKDRQWSYVGRRASASPATGYPKLHNAEQEALVKEALVEVRLVSLRVPAAIHQQPQPKSSSRRNSPRFDEGALPSEGDPDCDGKVHLGTKRRSRSKRCFGSALRPYHADWELPPSEAFDNANIPSWIPGYPGIDQGTIYFTYAKDLCEVVLLLLFGWFYKRRITSKRPALPMNNAEDFRAGVFSCTERPCNCLWAFFMQQVRMGDTFEASGVTSFWAPTAVFVTSRIIANLMGLVPGMPAGLPTTSMFFFQAIFYARWRNALRRELSLQRNDCGDFCLYSLCAPCLAAQELVRERKVPISLEKDGKALIATDLKLTEIRQAKTSSVHSAHSAHSAQEGFLLSTCLEPASGLQLRHKAETAPEIRESSGSEPVQSWADTDLYTSLRSWVRQDLDEVLGVKATDAEIRTRWTSVDISGTTGSPPQSLSGSSESSQPNWDCTDADASTDMEGEARCLPMAESIHVGGYEMMAPATKARVFR